MDSANQRHVTEILVKHGAKASVEDLFPIVYDELRRLARKYFLSGNPNVIIQPTALVHEAFLRLVQQTRVDWMGRTHFFAVSAIVMRRIFIDFARERKRLKRGFGLNRVTLDSGLLAPETGALDLDTILFLHEAIEKLAKLDEREAKIVDLRFFAGLTNQEIADYLGVSLRTVNGDWVHARAWLRRELTVQ